MFYSITGKLVHTEAGKAVIDVNGVAFQCSTSMNTLRNLPKMMEIATLYTHLNVRDDALTLYGFSTMLELNFFRTLTTITGVGPKAGISILSELTPEEVAMAAASADVKQLTRASGVGPKLAQRIILEMKDKVKDMVFVGEGIQDFSGGVSSVSSNASQAVNALASLGYSPSEAAAVIGKLDSALSVEELIRMALKSFAQK